MKREVARLQDGRFDVLVIGGGIIGAGIARDAALRGFKVAVIDRGDFGSGTSSRSSKLIHGGLRYLKAAEFRLVRESCRERELLNALAPGFIRPIPMILPCYRETGRPIWEIRLGLALYDLLTGNLQPVSRRHRMLDPVQTLAMEPGLDPAHLAGGGLYFDCRMNDARFCLENIRDACACGAIAANYVRATGLIKENGYLTGVTAFDGEGGGEFRISARIVINATGPWADAVRRMDDPAAKPQVRRTRGIHLITKRQTQSAGLALNARSDGRLIFVLPFETDYSLIGTTDTDSDEDPAHPAVERRDAEYLLSEVNAHLPKAHLDVSDIIGAFAGLRTLLAADGEPSRVSREYVIEEKSSGLISIIGGKYTTYRVMAKQVVDRAARRLDRNVRCITSTRPLIGRAESGSSGGALNVGEIQTAIRSEMARRPMDFLRRRTVTALLRPPDESDLLRITGIFQKELNWPADRAARILEETRSEWNSYHPDFQVVSSS